MQIIKEYGKDELVYENIVNLSSVEQINIEYETININFQEIINSQFTGCNIGELFEQVKIILNLSKYSKAPCGGLY